MMSPETKFESIELHLKSQLDNEGCVCLERFQAGVSTIQVARELGETLQLSNIPIVQQIVPKKQEESTDSLYSGNFGLKEFPFHTDLAHWYIPPRYLMLRCVTPSACAFTAIEEIATVLAGVPRSIIYRALFLPRKKLGGKKHLLRLAQDVGDNQLFRWDSIFIVPANCEAQEISGHLMSLDVKAARRKVALTYPGDTLVIDNWRMLHGRSAIYSSDMTRTLERVYLKEIYS
jgi:L-asparagine oxygenase